MKLFLVLLLVGYASATVFEALERESRATLNAFVNGIQRGMPLHEALGVDDSPEVQRTEISIKEQLEKHIKEAFDKALKKIEDAVKANKTVNQEALEKLRDLKTKLEELNIDESELKIGLDVLKNIVDSQLKLILEKMGILDKRRSVDNELFESVLGDLNIRDMFIKLKNMVLEKMDIGAVKNSLAKIIGQGSQKLCEWLTNKGKEKVLNFFDRVLETDEETEKRAADDNIEIIRDYLENIEKDTENKLVRFKEWLDNLFHRGLEEAKEGLQNIRKLVKEITADGKTLTKEGIAEILEYLLEYGD